MVFRIKKYVGPARGPARLLLSVHLEGVHRLLLLPCVFSPVPRIKKCAGPARGPARVIPDGSTMFSPTLVLLE